MGAASANGAGTSQEEEKEVGSGNERALIGHEAVALVAVGREPNEVKGEVAHAYVVVAAGTKPTADELITYCRLHLAAHKVPKVIHFVEALPTTCSGKLMRRMLRSTCFRIARPATGLSRPEKAQPPSGRTHKPWTSSWPNSVKASPAFNPVASRTSPDCTPSMRYATVRPASAASARRKLP